MYFPLQYTSTIYGSGVTIFSNTEGTEHKNFKVQVPYSTSQFAPRKSTRVWWYMMICTIVSAPYTWILLYQSMPTYAYTNSSLDRYFSVILQGTLRWVTLEQVRLQRLVVLEDLLPQLKGGTSTLHGQHKIHGVAHSSELFYEETPALSVSVISLTAEDVFKGICPSTFHFHTFTRKSAQSSYLDAEGHECVCHFHFHFHPREKYKKGTTHLTRTVLRPSGLTGQHEPPEHRACACARFEPRGVLRAMS